MPHCIIEYSAELVEDINIEKLMSLVFEGADKSTLFSTTDIKVRAIAFKDYYSDVKNEGNSTQKRFVHVCCKILSGRDLDQRQHLAKLILNELTSLNMTSVSMSVEIVDMERESYNKQVS